MHWVPVGTGSSPSSSSTSSRRGRASRQRPLKDDAPRPLHEDKRRSLNGDTHGEYTTYSLFSPEELQRHRRLVKSAPASPTREGNLSAWSPSHHGGGADSEATAGVWPLTPSSCARTPSPSLAPPPQPTFIMMPMAFPVPPMPLPLAAPNSPWHWAGEVSSLAARLHALAQSAPTPLEERLLDREIATDIGMRNVDSWEAAADDTEQLQTKVAELEEQAASMEAEASSAEQERLAAQAQVQALTDQLADREESKHAERLKEHHAATVALRAATERAELSVKALASAKRDVERRATASAEMVAKLRAQLAKQVEATSEARQKVARAKNAQELAQDLPRLRARQKAAETKAAQLVKDCDSMQQQVRALQAEEATLQSGNSARADGLQARVSQLEEECHQLQQTDTGMDAEGNLVTSTATEDLQESNQRLLAEIREARAEHDEAHAPLAAMEADVKNFRSRLDYSDLELEDIQQQISEEKGKNIELKEKVEVLRAELASEEQRAKDKEDENQAWKRKLQEANEAYRQTRDHNLKLEKACLELGGKLQNSLTKLEKEKPEEPLSRCLRYSRPREKWSNACRLRPRDRLGGSDAGSESIDADVSTTCGESAVDMDLGQLGV